MVFALVIHNTDSIFYERFYSPLSLEMRSLLGKEIAKLVGAQNEEKKLHGILRLRLNNGQRLANGAEFIIWRKKAGVFYTLLLERDESIIVAENALSHATSALPIVPSIQELFSTKLDEVITLLDHFFPCGMLYTITPIQERFLKKEADNATKM